MGPLRNSFIGTMSKTVLLVLLALGGGRVASAGKRAVPSSHQLRRQELSHTEDLRRQLRETKRALADAQQALAEKKQKLEQVEAQLLQSERRVVATLEAELSEHADGGLQGWAEDEENTDDDTTPTSSHLVLQEAHNKLKERFQSLWKLQQEQQEAQGREREEWQKWEEEREQMLAKLLSCILVRDYIAGPGFYCSATSATTAAEPAPLKLPLLALAGGRSVSASACSGVEELESAGTPSTAASGGRETPGTGSSSASTTSSTGGCAECSLDAECGPFEGENRAPGDDVSSTVRVHRGKWVAALQAVHDLVRGAKNKPLRTASRESAWCSFSSEAARLMAGGARGAAEAEPDGRGADDECLALLEHGIQHLQLEVPGI